MPFRFFLPVLLIGLIIGAGSVFASDHMTSKEVKKSHMAEATEATVTDGCDDTDFFDDYEYTDHNQLVSDPLSGFNLVMFNFNDAMFHGVLKPLAEGYAWAVPARPRQWIRNFFTNLLFPVRFINNILQGKFDAAYMETSKFIANTCFGLLGFADVTASRKRNWEPKLPTADGFDQTLGKAGIGHGVYIVWPFFGPCSVRGTVGRVADNFLHPMTYANLTFVELAAINSFNNVNNLSLQLTGNEYEALTEGAIDKYAAVRDAYIRFRAKKAAE